jgi:hypothetical protein
MRFRRMLLVTAAAGAAIAWAAVPAHAFSLLRQLGMGWSDGYHARGGGPNPLPPETFWTADGVPVPPVEPPVDLPVQPARRTAAPTNRSPPASSGSRQVHRIRHRPKAGRGRPTIDQKSAFAHPASPSPSQRVPRNFPFRASHPIHARLPIFAGITHPVTGGARRARYKEVREVLDRPAAVFDFKGVIGGYREVLGRLGTRNEPRRRNLDACCLVPHGRTPWTGIDSRKIG